MKQTPLIFSKESLDALANTKPGVWPAEPINPALPFKWQTRRPVKMERVLRMRNALRSGITTETALHEWNKDVTPAGRGGFIFWQTTFELTPEQHAFHLAQYRDEEGVPCPYGAPGDQIWSRETWSVKEPYPLSAEPRWAKLPEVEPQNGALRRLDYWRRRIVYRAQGEIFEMVWRAPIYQPKWAARFWFELKDVQVERVCQITAEDAVAEGIAYEVQDMALTAPDYQDEKGGRFQDWDGNLPKYSPNPLRDSYRSLWQKIHGAAHPWEATWVWVLSFMVIAKEPAE